MSIQLAKTTFDDNREGPTRIDSGSGGGDSETSGQKAVPARRNRSTQARETPAPRDAAAIRAALNPCEFLR
jgi:hypothetical protein